MERTPDTTSYLLDHCRRYPALQPGDLLKALHQSVFGCGHFVRADGDGLERLRRELAGLPPESRGDVEPLDGEFCRVHLGLLQRTALRPETLFRLFCLSAEKLCGTKADLEKKLSSLKALAETGQLPFPAAELTAAVAAWREAGFPACSHTEAFRRHYAPAYRVLHRDYARLLPLLTAIDDGLAEKGRLLVAIEGGAASGKSTLGELLTHIYDCTLFHADDYFLQPHQRSAERLAEAGGNLDRERLEAELLRPWKTGGAVTWRRYDCHSQRLCPAVETELKPLTILEGAYSMHPDLEKYYDLSVFLDIGPELQAQRILRRNTPEMAERFFTTWLPLERRYFEATGAAKRCGLILEVDT